MGTCRVFEVSVDGLLRVEVVGLRQKYISHYPVRELRCAPDLQEADSLLARRAGEADKVVDGVLGRFRGHGCKGGF